MISTKAIFTLCDIYFHIEDNKKQTNVILKKETLFKKKQTFFFQIHNYLKVKTVFFLPEKQTLFQKYKLYFSQYITLIFFFKYKNN